MKKTPYYELLCLFPRHRVSGSVEHRQTSVASTLARSRSSITTQTTCLYQIVNLPADIYSQNMFFSMPDNCSVISACRYIIYSLQKRNMLTFSLKFNNLSSYYKLSENNNIIICWDITDVVVTVRGKEQSTAECRPLRI